MLITILFFKLLLSVEQSRETSISYKVLEGENITFDCPSATPEFYVQYWILNNHLVLTPNGKFSPYKYAISSIDGGLTIKFATANDSGVYTCITESHTKGFKDVSSSEVSLLVRKKEHPVDAWESQIKPSLIRGAVAAAGLAAIIAFLCLVYKFRWKNRTKNNNEEVKSKHPNDGSTEVNSTYYNTAMDLENNCHCSLKQNETQM